MERQPVLSHTFPQGLMMRAKLSTREGVAVCLHCKTVATSQCSYIIKNLQAATVDATYTKPLNHVWQSDSLGMECLSRNV